MTSRLDYGDVYLYDKTSADSEAPCLIDNLAAQEENQEELYANKQEKEANLAKLTEALTHLNEREKYIINARKLTDNAKTLEELSLEFNVSKERIRQIEQRALEKIKIYFTTA